MIAGVVLDGFGEELNGFLVTLGLEGLVPLVLEFGGELYVAHKRYNSRILLQSVYKC